MSKRVNHYMMILLKNLNVYVLKFQLLPQQDLKKFLNHYLLWLQKLSHFLFTSFPTKCFTCRYGMRFFKPNSCKYKTFIEVQQFKQQPQQQKENRENQKHQICFTT